MHPWKRAHALAKGRQHAHAVARQHEKRRRKRPQKSDHSHSLLSRAEQQRSTLWPCLTGRSACECVLENRDFFVCESKQCSWMLAYIYVVRRKKKEFFCEMIFVRACVFYGRVESVLEFFVVGRLNVLIKSHRETIVCPVQGCHPTKTNACPSPK